MKTAETALIEKKCVPCEGGTPSLTAGEVKLYLIKVDQGWNVFEYRKISRSFVFKNYKDTMAFVNQVADLANLEGHHPVMVVAIRSVDVELWTHAVDGLSENDFVMAAKIDGLLAG